LKNVARKAVFVRGIYFSKKNSIDYLEIPGGWFY